MSYKDITYEQYEQMLVDLENRTFVSTARYSFSRRSTSMLMKRLKMKIQTSTLNS
jgi:hypothetical protein